MDKLLLQDPSVTVEREASESLGFGLRCGFLGLLHMDVFHTRLQDDFNTPVIATAPMVPYTLVRDELSLCTTTVTVSPLTHQRIPIADAHRWHDIRGGTTGRLPSSP